MQTAAPAAYDLPGSAFVILTAATNTGKSLQMLRAFNARVPGSQARAVTPTVLLYAEASTEGTMGEFMADPSLCLPWAVRTCDEAMDALRIVFPEGRGPLTLGEARRAWHDQQTARARATKGAAPPPALAVTASDHLPIRSLGVDSVSTLHEGQMNWVRDNSGGSRSTNGRDLSNDRKRQAGLAAGPTNSLVDMLSGVTIRNRGMLTIVACHTRKQEEIAIIGADANGKGGERVAEVIGEAPDFGAPTPVRAGCSSTGYSALWAHLAAKANAIWHLYRIEPDLRRVADVNAPDAGVIRHGAITMIGNYPSVGKVLWAKRQGGAGWLTWFDQAPRMWDRAVAWADDKDFRAELARSGCASASGPDPYDGGPHLGAVIELCIAQARAGRAA